MHIHYSDKDSNVVFGWCNRHREINFLVCIIQLNGIYCTTGCPKKNGLLSSFEFLGLGGAFLRVKNNSKNFRNKKILGC